MNEWKTDIRTNEELERIREDAIKYCNKIGCSSNFTCDNCPSKLSCKYVYDPYNTNGDCLAEK